MSDLHVAGPGCPRQEAFLRFLAGLECDRLYLCGDVFEHWWHWGDRPFTQYAPVVDALSRFSLAVLPGNHDWLAPEFFGRVLGATVGVDGVLREDWGGASAVVAHGDQADRSVGYGFACAVLRGAVSVPKHRQILTNFAIDRRCLLIVARGLSRYISKFLV